MRFSVISPVELGPDEVAAWRFMQHSTPFLANPFLSPEFTNAVALFRPGARVAVLSEGPSIAGFFPFERRSLGVGVPIAAGLNDCQGLIHAPGTEWDVEELLRACRLSAWQFDHLANGQGSFDGYRSATLPSPVIDLTSGFESYYQEQKARSAQFCRNLERKVRKITREVGELRFVPDSRDSSAFVSLLSWKSDQYRRTGQIDIFARPWIAGLAETLFTIRDSNFSSLLSVLYAGDVPVAAHFGLRCSHTLAYWFPAYDTRFSRYSPGLILSLRVAEFASSIGIQIIDLGAGHQRYKEELKTDDIFVGKGIVTRHSLLAAAHRARTGGGQWAAQTIRQHPHLLTAATWFRKRYRLLRNS
jgi:CelD/BcsL family acetyltransferase involved in cellulose biosynthesis